MFTIIIMFRLSVWGEEGEGGGGLLREFWTILFKIPSLMVLNIAVCPDMM